MQVRKFLPIVIAGGLLGAALLGVNIYQKVSAQSETPVPSTPEQIGPLGKGMRGEFRRGATEEQLAEALGIDVATLQAAYQTASTEALKQAVEQGLLTQEQADQLAARGDGMHGFGRMGKWANGTIDFQALLADALGITTGELQAAQQEAFFASLDQAVTDGNLTQEQADLIKAENLLYNSESFQSGMQSAFEAAVAQAVQDGTISQAQADLILQAMNDRGGFRMGPGFGGRGPGRFEGRGPGGRHGRGGDWLNDQPQPTTPSDDTSSSGGA